MTELPDYLIKLSVGLAVAYIFYYTILRRHTFYAWNRWYLLLYSSLAFLIPFINVSTILPEEHLMENNFISQVPQIGHFTQNVSLASAMTSVAPEEPLNWLMIFFVTGIILMTCRFCLHIYFYIRIKRKAQLVSEDDVSLYHVDREIVPFSFGNSIFINPSLHSDEELEKIILHEYVHVRQKHTFDNIWAEILCILNWYNPFAWLIRNAIRQNLEYIADDQVLKQQVDVKQYQYLLLKVTGVPEFHLANQFNFASLKQRIIMMNKARTPRVFLIRFLFLVPLIAVSLIAFRPEINPVQFLTEKKTVIKHEVNTDKSVTSIFVKISETLNYSAGIILDAATRKPLANFPLRIVIAEKVVNTIYTDKDGYYYTQVKLDTSRKDYVLYTIEAANPDYKNYARMAFTTQYIEGFGRLSVDFIRPNIDSTIRPAFYSPKDKLYQKNANQDIVKREVKAHLTKLVPAYTDDIQLKVDFKKYHPFPKNVITKFKNGYFDRRKELVGYEDVTKFYLDGKRATYQDVNEAFRPSPYMLDDTKMTREWGWDGVYSKMSFITFSLYKDAPPARLMAGNSKNVNPSTFDMSVLNKEAYFLDGFRQVAGIGSNLKPMKSEIRKVVLFTGRLARYYDAKLDKVWWIETRPENEVFGRPDLAKN